MVPMQLDTDDALSKRQYAWKWHRTLPAQVPAPRPDKDLKEIVEKLLAGNTPREYGFVWELPKDGMVEMGNVWKCVQEQRHGVTREHLRSTLVHATRPVPGSHDVYIPRFYVGRTDEVKGEYVLFLNQHKGTVDPPFDIQTWWEKHMPMDTPVSWTQDADRPWHIRCHQVFRKMQELRGVRPEDA